MQAAKKFLTDLACKAVGCAVEVHKVPGPEPLETVYEACFLGELSLQGIRYSSQPFVTLGYNGAKVDTAFRFDVLLKTV